MLIPQQEPSKKNRTSQHKSYLLTEQSDQFSSLNTYQIGVVDMQPATEQEALDLLKKLNIHYRRVDHPAIWTMNDPNTPKGLPEVKNLLLKQKKK